MITSFAKFVIFLITKKKLQTMLKKIKRMRLQPLLYCISWSITKSVKQKRWRQAN